MPTCPNCHSSDRHRYYPVSHHHGHHAHYHPPHHFDPSHQGLGLGGLLIGGLIVGGIALAAKAMENAEKNKKFHKVKYKCQNCNEIFEDWNITDKVSFDWTIKNETPFTLSVRFFSQHRGVAWPGFDSSWPLTKGEKYTFSLGHALKDEKVCYGAWKKHYSLFDDPQWGVGRNNGGGSRCCYTFSSSRGSGSITLVYSG